MRVNRCKTCGFSSTTKSQFGHGMESGEYFHDPSLYRCLEGRVIYLTVTRSNICYAVHILSQFMQAPKQERYKATITVVKYLMGHLGKGILIPRECDIMIREYSDSN